MTCEPAPGRRCAFKGELLSARKQSVDSKRVAYAENVAWRIVVQPDREMEIHLLTGGQMVQAS